MYFLFLYLLVTLLDQYKRTTTRCGSSSVTSWSKNIAVAWLFPSLSSSLPTYTWWWGNVSNAAVRKKVKSHLFVVSWIIPYCIKVGSGAGALQLFHGMVCLNQAASILVGNFHGQCRPWRRWLCSEKEEQLIHVLCQMQIHYIAGNLFSKIRIKVPGCFSAIIFLQYSRCALSGIWGIILLTPYAKTLIKHYCDPCPSVALVLVWLESFCVLLRPGLLEYCVELSSAFLSKPFQGRITSCM